MIEPVIATFDALFATCDTGVVAETLDTVAPAVVVVQAPVVALTVIVPVL